MVTVGPVPPSTDVPARRLTLLELNDTLGPLVTTGETDAAKLTLPVKPFRPVTLVGRAGDDVPGAMTAALPLETIKVCRPEQVTRVGTL